MKARFILFAVLFPTFLIGQINLVLNPSFEDSLGCPTDTGTRNTKCWFNPISSGTPDYFHSSFNPNCNSVYPGIWGGGGYANSWGYSLPRTGSAYAGMGVTQGSELMAGKLSDTLITGKKYSVSFYTSLCDLYFNQGAQGLDLIGICFMQDSVTDYTINDWTYLGTLQVDAGNQSGNFLTDTAAWMFVQDTFIAEGGERYFVLGNIDTANTQYYNSTVPTGCYYYFDDFDVHCVDCTQDTSEPPFYSEFSLSPNPTSGQFSISGNFPAQTHLIIYNSIGQKITEVGKFPVGNNSVSVQLQLAQGLYYYELHAIEKLAEGKLMIVE